MKKIVILMILGLLSACSPQTEMKSRVTDVAALQAAGLVTRVPVEPTEIPSARAVVASQEKTGLDAIRDYLGRTELEGENLGRTESLNFPGLEVDRYRIDGVEFEVNVETQQIVWIDTANSLLPKNLSTVLVANELQSAAEKLVGQLAPDLALESFQLVVNQKGENTFFRWSDGSGLFIQVGFDSYGNLLNFCNATGQ